MAGYRRAKVAVVSEAGKESVIVGPKGVKVPSGSEKLTVSEVEKLTGTSKETLRFYDQKGLLCPERTGEYASNNRKLYGPEDLERLQAIQTLRAYSFTLREIEQILDGEVDIYDVMSAKLTELRRQEARLRALVLFAHFVDLADNDLIEGLANGPYDIEALAETARANPMYEEALQRLDSYSEEEAARALDDLGAIADSLMSLDEARGFKGVERLIDRLFDWWDSFVVPVEKIGYLGFWVLFEDHGLIPEYIESRGQAGDAGFMQMFAFFVLMTRLMKRNDLLISDIALLAGKDVVAALDESQQLVSAISSALLGTEYVEFASESELAYITCSALDLMEGIVGDFRLKDSLGLNDILSIDEDALEKVMQVVDLMEREE